MFAKINNVAQVADNEEFTHHRHDDDDINYTTSDLNGEDTAPFSTYT